MKVILTTNIKKVGKMGEQVNVKPGYARNYLFPNNMALRNSDKNKEIYLKIKDEMVEKEAEKQNDAKKLIEKVSKIKISFKREADEKDQLYGSISKKEIIDFFEENNIKIKSDDLILKQSIKSLGEHEIEINPYIDVSQTFKLTVTKN